MFANVIVDIVHEKLDKVFQYIVPKELEQDLTVGMKVIFPFGASNKKTTGYLLELTEESEYDLSKMKYLIGISKNATAIDQERIALAYWMKENYGGTMIQALKTVLPVKNKVKTIQKISVCLNKTMEEIDTYIDLCKRRNAMGRVHVLEAIKDKGTVPIENLETCAKSYKTIVKELEKKGYIKLQYESIYRIPEMKSAQNYERKTLTVQQREIVENIWDIYNNFDRENEKAPVCLIHGITGSGKTEVYLELIEKVIADGKQVIVLIPEISLTYQIVMRFYTRFGDRVAVMNSKMSLGERYDQFERARNAQADIIIGPRSALFAPFERLGLIIIDEEHEASYKSETTPRYHARETAIKRAQMNGALTVLGSATPSIETYEKAKSKEYYLFELKERVNNRQLAKVEIVDLREELKKGNRSYFSNALVNKMEERLQKKQQIMLFLNRRGYAGFLSCRSCGEVIKCPHCDISLTLHYEKGEKKLRCHYCGYEQKKADKCPSCGSGYIGELKAGTQQIEEAVTKLFPQAKVLRMDLDTTRSKDSYANILDRFSKREADILIGTQMIVKGHDFPGVTLVGIIAADLSLNTGDYRSAERTFQLLTQAAGRAGRGDTKGEVIIQTYQPEHYAIVQASGQDYKEFYEQEVMYRNLLHYPPNYHMLEIQMSCEEEEHLNIACFYIKKMIDYYGAEKQFQIIGPADANVSKVNDRYRKHILIKNKEYEFLVYLKNKLENYIKINTGFQTVQVQFDFNPMNIW